MINIGDWKPWVELFDGFWDRSRIWKVIWIRPEDDRLAAAAACSVAKWHPARNVDAGHGPCGLCMYMTTIENTYDEDICTRCKAVSLCGNLGSDLWSNLYREWRLATDGSNRKQSKAIEMYQGLLEIYRDVSNHTERSV